MEATLDIELEQRRQLLDAWVATRQRIAELEAEASALGQVPWSGVTVS